MLTSACLCCLQALNDVPVYFVQGLYIEEAPSAKYEGTVISVFATVASGMLLEYGRGLTKCAGNGHLRVYDCGFP